MNGNAVTAGYKAYYIVTGKRIAATGKFNKAVVNTFNHNALVALCALFGRS